MTNAASVTQLAAILLGALLAPEQRQREWTFTDDKPGEKPAGFYFDETNDGPPGKWQVVDDGGNHVLAQLDELDEEFDDHRYTLAIVEDSRFEHVKLSVRIKAVRGKHDQSAGVVWRYRNSENYLVARLDVTERNVRLSRFRDGNRTGFGKEGDLDLKTGQWYTLRVEHRGREIKVYLDDEVLFIEHDRHFRRRPGKIGLWVKSDSVMYFDDLKVQNLEARDDEDEDN
jgi:hypothetical protein